jgi:Ca2+-binding RTX toxin-like protein
LYRRPLQFITTKELRVHGIRFRRGCWVVVAALIACATSASAQAGTADFDGSVVMFEAAPGEQNHVRITESPGGVFTIVDSVPLTTTDCDQVDQFTVECAIQYGIGVAAKLGDLDDSLVIDAFWIERLEAGDGSDTIRVSGGPGIATVRGGPGDDVLVDAGRRGQHLRGGAGDDRLVSRTSGTRMRGRGGDDVLDAHRGDRVVASGGPGNDRLLGSPSSDELSGGPGRDVLSGKRRRDLLLGGLGNDVLFGGRGGDRIQGAGGHDRIFGGGDRDVVDGGLGNDMLGMREGEADRVKGGIGFDRARVDAGLDEVFGVEALVLP